MRANIGGIFDLFFCCCLALGLEPGGEASGAETAQRVRIAYASRSSSAMPQYMAHTKGFFKAERLDVELIQMNPRLGTAAVVGGDVSFATPFFSTFRGVLQGFPMKLVFVHFKKGPLLPDGAARHQRPATTKRQKAGSGDD
jgi:ABC-type nitrate/sulfonate/bicarbonate transport system substrate-binding protein